MLRRFAVAFAASATLTLLVAWPVVERPTERIYGTEISGRHPDPFAAMRRLDVSIADRLLKRNGRMVRAVETIGPGHMAAEGEPTT
jgi:hypothetical protein